MCVLPSIVTQAKTVLEYGAHAISPTWDSRSKMKRGTLGIENKKIIVISIELLLWRIIQILLYKRLAVTSFEDTTVFRYLNTYLEFSSQTLTNLSDAQLANIVVM